ncbi:cyclophilin-like domain-containing protein [Aspergillus ambiguus]|uniref:putative peptidyl-prolyl cis-trans isomerase n=1 Tax=Aspergillus ambiguus TaxID=176160 RepID=UPI003CCD6570
MSSHYTTEPNPTASATLNTTFGPLHISLFATQAPLTCRNFLQHCMDDYYAGTIFHRIVPDFIIQGGDPTGTGEGGVSIYEDPEFEYDPTARDPNEKVVLRDELHSRLRFNRRGLVGMAKSEDGSYGSQFFITLANAERELNGQCTLFGRIEGDSIYNMVKIAEAERVDGSDRPVYPVKILSCEVGELGPLASKIKKRDLAAKKAQQHAAAATQPPPKKKKKAKAAKTLLSFGGDDDDAEGAIPVRPAKPKFNPNLVTDVNPPLAPASAPPPKQAADTRKRPRSPSHERRKRPKTPDPDTQLPLPDPESPERSPTPPPPQSGRQAFLSRTNAEIENVKASMRRTVDTGPADSGRKLSALEAMIPETAIRGRKRPAAGTSSGANGITGFGSSSEREALKLFNAFKAKLEGADSTTAATAKRPAREKTPEKAAPAAAAEQEDEEAQLCDLHFIANCQSCRSWADGAGEGDAAGGGGAADDGDAGWLTHELRFGKDTLGKDLKWRQEHPDDVDSLMVIDPREREKEIVGGRRRGLERDRERDRKRERVGNLEWDRSRRAK